MSTPLTSLLDKYNVPAPRYTSYPTVPYWDTTPSEEQWIEHLAKALHLSQAAENKIGAALYIHIPFCEKLCSFCGCNTRITKNHGVSDPYIAALHKEWNLYRTRLAAKKPILVSEVHLGGGTPTFLSGDELRALLEPIFAEIEFLPEFECSIEVDPRVTTREHMAALSGLGFRRISLGVQDFQANVQTAINRVQTQEQVEKCVVWARELGFKSINFDLIYGLPFQTTTSIADTFQKVIKLKPDRIAFYAYAHVPWIKPTQRHFSEVDLPSAQLKRALYETGRTLLADAGYLEIGMDHFALASDSLWQALQSKTLHRNFMGYMSRHVSPLLGLGVSAISDSWDAFVQNEKILEKYYHLLQKDKLPILRGHRLSAEDLLLRQHIANLMTRFATDWQEDEDMMTKLQIVERLRVFSDDGLIALRGASLEVTPLGKPFVRNISMAFDARLARQQPTANLFSKSI